MIHFIPPNSPPVFPPPETADSDGLLAIGGDLSTERLLAAYANGIFPWYNPGEIIQWWCPKRRYLIFPSEIHISKSMKKFMNKTTLTTKINENFADVIAACKNTRMPPNHFTPAQKHLAEIYGDYGTWITDEMETAYNKLFDEGYAMCIGTYHGERLVGGLYGVKLGKKFYGESMFSLAPNASKLALISLCKRLTIEGFAFVDCQFHTEHLETMGGKHVSWNEYSQLLKN